MYKQKLALVSLLFLFFGLSKLRSQISVTPSSGCLPVGVTNAVFAYTGSGNPTNIVWNYGDGSPTTTLTTTQHSYGGQGSYTVTFTAIINGSPVTYTFLVNVYAPPTGNFSTNVPATHCAPMTVGFTGNSSSSNVNYIWAFGDLQGGSGVTTSHVYGAGTYSPILTIQNTVTGCFANIVGSAIKISNPPIIIITANPGYNSCSSPFTTSLDGSGSISNSPSGGALTYAWNLGSFGSSGAASTGNVVFQPLGTYVVTLTATDDNNCSSSLTKTIKIETPTVSITVPSTVCIDYQSPSTPPYFYVTINTNQISSVWDMGDGTVYNYPFNNVPISSVYSNTIHSYSTPGLKTVSVTVTTGQCSASTSTTIMVEKIIPQFGFSSPSFYCNSPAIITFTDQSTLNTSNSLTYTWSVPGWGSAPTLQSNAANPTFTFTQGSINPYANYNHPPYIIVPKVMITSQPAGCITSTTHVTDTLQRSTSQYEISTNEGCAPLSVTFSNTSVTSWTFSPSQLGYTVTPNPILSYTWNFGASPSSTLAGTTTAPNYSVLPVTFNYSAPGVYYPTLTIQTALGCTNISIQHTITVVNQPTFNVTLPPSPVCAGNTVQLHMSSSQAIDHWHIDTDAGYFSGCISDASPTWTMSHTGTHDYTVSGYLSGCKTQSVFPAAIQVLGPLGKFTFETNCTTNRKMIKYIYHLEDALSATLDYGDGTPLYNITSAANTTLDAFVNHTYASAGTYTVKLISVNAANLCGNYTYSTVVQVFDTHANFAFTNSVICDGASILMSAATSTDAFNSNCALSYIWYIDNLKPQATSAPGYGLPVTGVGIHTAKLVIKDLYGCTDEIIKNFRVSSPAPNFTFNANPLCYSNQPAIFLNTTPQTPDPIASYTFVVGDSIMYPPGYFPQPFYNSILTGTTANFSPSFTYPSMGFAQTITYTVTLYAETNIGCVSKIKHLLTINNPMIQVSAPRTGCTPTAAALAFTVSAANTHSNYNINWGDGTPTVNITSFSTNANYISVHNYLNTGTYTPVFTLTDFGGCKVTTTITSPPIIIETAPVASFTFYNVADPNNKTGPGPFCAPLSPSVTSTTQSPYSLTYYWNLGDASGTQASLLPNAFTNYGDVEGTYTISLKVVTQIAGCSSSTSVPVVLLSPHINFAIRSDSLKRTYCLGDPITFSVTSHKGTQYYQWDFGDGVVTNTVLVDNFKLNTVYTNSFFPANTNGTFTVILTGYAEAGTNQTGYTVCKEKKTIQLNLIRALPAFDRNNELLKIDTAHCFGKVDVFKNKSVCNITSNLSYTWTLGDGKTEYGTDVNHAYQPGTYLVKLQVLEPVNSCTASVTKQMVIFPLPTGSLSIDSFSCPNEPFTIRGSGLPGVSGLLTGSLNPGPIPLTFDANNTFSLSTTASVSTTYSLKVTDNNGCEAAASTASIYIQQAAPIVHWDTTIIIGQHTPLNAFVGSGFSYTWQPVVSYLNCDTCTFYNPVSTTTTDITYSVSVEDSKKCSIVESTYRIHVDIKASLDVPSAFTPNGDGTNDIIYPDGWGLRKLVYFKIFNRWGQLLFESNDLKVGWDGTYMGVPQNIETYVYQAMAETYDPYKPTITKTGTFKLLR